jgi:hypothetical protein
LSFLIKGNYYLPRAKTLPLKSLIQAVWPWVDEWLDWFRSFNNNEKSQCEKDRHEKEGNKKDCDNIVI